MEQFLIENWGYISATLAALATWLLPSPWNRIVSFVLTRKGD